MVQCSDRFVTFYLEHNYVQYSTKHPAESDIFLSIEELRAKFDGLTGPYLDAADREAFAEALLNLETAEDIGAVLALSRPRDSVHAVAGE